MGQDAGLFFLYSCFLLAEPGLVVARPRSARCPCCRSQGEVLRAGMADLPSPGTCSVLRTQGGQRPPGAFFYGRNSYQNHKQKTKHTHTQNGGAGKSFVKVLLGSYFCIILPINAVFAVGIWRQMIYVFMVFYGRYPSGRALSGGRPGQGGGSLGSTSCQMQTGGEPADVCVFPPQWAVF